MKTGKDYLIDMCIIGHCEIEDLNWVGNVKTLERDTGEEQDLDWQNFEIMSIDRNRIEVIAGGDWQERQKLVFYFDGVSKFILREEFAAPKSRAEQYVDRIAQKQTEADTHLSLTFDQISKLIKISFIEGSIGEMIRFREGTYEVFSEEHFSATLESWEDKLEELIS